MFVGFDGEILATATRVHVVDHPQPGHVEMDAEFWWDEFVQLRCELLGTVEADVVAVSGSGGGSNRGPCVLVPDGADVIGAQCAPVASTQAIGASSGAAFLTASATAEMRINDCNPSKEPRWARTETPADYQELYQLYRERYRATRGISHALAERRRRPS